MKGRLRLGAWLVCLGLIGTGLYLALLAPAPSAFGRVDGRIKDVTVVSVSTASGSDRRHELTVAGAPCGAYDYLESWASSAGLPSITDLNNNEVVTVYTDPRSCAGFAAGGHGRLVAIVYQGRLYATPAYRARPSGPRAGLAAGLMLLAIGAAGILLLLRRSLAGGPSEPLR